jgi:8-oxo-dGTP pyrophosphatase MutT (NUDIX family)
MNKNNNCCNNCGKQGHQFYQCKLPITSYGIVLFRPSIKGLQYLMIRRKDSFGYIDFLRGKYTQNNFEQLQNMFNEMSIDERNCIKNNNFDILWKTMWGTVNTSLQHKLEESSSNKKFDALKCGILDDDKNLVTINSLIDNASTVWHETEWEFPKGRRNFQEKDLDCALREFEEETGLTRLDIKIIENVLPFEEIFIGSNHKSYKHKYFLAYTDKINDVLLNYQPTEVSKIEWKTVDECLASIRPYHLDKKQIIQNINKVLNEYRIY